MSQFDRLFRRVLLYDAHFYISRYYDWLFENLGKENLKGNKYFEGIYHVLFDVII